MESISLIDSERRFRARELRNRYDSLINRAFPAAPQVETLCRAEFREGESRDRVTDHEWTTVNTDSFVRLIHRVKALGSSGSASISLQEAVSPSSNLNVISYGVSSWQALQSN